MQLTDKGLRTFNENEEFDVEEFNNKNMLRLDEMLVCNYIADNLTKMNELYPPSATYVGKRCRTKDNNKVYTCLTDGSSYAWINIHDLIEAVKEKLVCQYVADSFSQLNTLYPPSATYLNQKCRVKSDNKVYKCKLVEGTYSWVDDNQGGGGGGGGSWGSIIGDIDDQIDLKNKLLGKLDYYEFTEGLQPSDETMNKLYYDSVNHDWLMSKISYDIKIAASTIVGKGEKLIGEGPIAERPEASLESPYYYWHATDENKWYTLFVFGTIALWMEYTPNIITDISVIYTANGTYLFVSDTEKTIYITSNLERVWIKIVSGKYGMDYKANVLKIGVNETIPLNEDSVGNIFVMPDGTHKRVKRIATGTRLYATSYQAGEVIVDDPTYKEGLFADIPEAQYTTVAMYYATDQDKYYKKHSTGGGVIFVTWQETEVTVVKKLTDIYKGLGYFKYKWGTQTDIYYTATAPSYKVITMYDAEIVDELPEQRDDHTIYFVKEI